MLKAMGAAALFVLFAGPALAQPKTLTVAGYGGVWDQHLRKEVFPAFEAKHGVKIEYVAGNSTDTLAKLQAQKGNQVIDVAIVDDGPMYQAIQLGFCAPIQGLDKSRALSGCPVQGRQGGRGRPDRHRLHDQHQDLQGEGLGDADLVERPQGSQVQEAAGHSADQQHLRSLYADDVCPHERRRREEHRSRLQGDEGRHQSQRAGLRALARQDDGAVPVGPRPDRGVGHRPRAGLRQHRLPGRLHLSQGRRADPARLGLPGRQGRRSTRWRTSSSRR